MDAHRPTPLDGHPSGAAHAALPAPEPLLTEAGLRAALGALGLTPRQQDVATLVVRGCANKAIAAHLAISEHTVKDHLKGIFDHLRLRSRAALTARVFGLDRPAGR